MLGFFTVSGGACALLRGRLAWKELAYPALILLPAMVVLASLWSSTTSDLLAGWGAVAWPAAFLAQYMLLRRFETEWSGATPWYHCGTLWLGVFLAWREVLWLSERSLSSTWSYSAAALVPACVVWTLATFGSRLEWPVQRYREVYLGAGLLPLVIGAVAWVLGAGFLADDPRPLDYVPLLNPVEMAQAISLLALFQWCSTDVVDASNEFRGRTLGFLGFVALNGVLARMTHHFLGVPFEVGALLSSVVFQGLLSFVWTSLACITMVAATRAGRRSQWRLGATLLTATVIKLFLFDLAATGTATRVVVLHRRRCLHSGNRLLLAVAAARRRRHRERRTRRRRRAAGGAVVTRSGPWLQRSFRRGELCPPRRHRGGEAGHRRLRQPFAGA